MRKLFVMAKSRYLAKKWCPWGAVFAKVEGGFIVFESADDYEIWKKQV